MGYVHTLALFFLLLSCLQVNSQLLSDASLGQKASNDCTKTVDVKIEGANATGSLSIKPNGTVETCVWKFDNVSDVLIIVVNERLHLEPTDSIVFTSQENKTILNMTASEIGSKLGVIFVNGVNGGGNITLTLGFTGKTTKPRVFSVKYASRSKDMVKNNEPPVSLSVEGREIYHIPLTNISNRVHQLADPLPSIKFIVTPEGVSDWSDKKLVIEVESNEGNIKLDCDGSTNIDGFDILADNPGKQITMKMSNFDFGKNRLVFTTDLVDAFCSSFDQKEGEFTLDTAVQGLQDKQSLNCLKLVYFNASAARLDFNLLHSLLGPSDILTIHDGGMEFRSKVALQVHSGNIEDISKSVLNTYIPSGKVRISYFSHFITPGTAVKIPFKADKESKVNPGPTDPIEIKSKDTNTLFVSVAKDTLKARFTVPPNSVPQTNVGFYDSLDSSAKPFAVLRANVVSPPYVVSPTNILRIKPLEAGKTTFTGSFDAFNDTSTTAVLPVDSISWTKVDTQTNSSTWLIPAQDDGRYDLVISQLVLPHDQACLTIDSFADNKQPITIVKECFIKNGVSLDANKGQNLQFPLIRLSSNGTYLLTYSLGSLGLTDVVAGSTLISASVSYSTNNPDSYVFTLQNENPSIEIKPSSYPGPVALSYPTMDSAEWLINTVAVKGAAAPFVHTVFYELELKGKQLVSVNSGNLVYNSSSCLPDDSLSLNNTLLRISSPLVLPTGKLEQLKNQTGFGFRTVSTVVSCGGVIDLTKAVNISTPGYPNQMKDSRCLWKVYVDSKADYNPIIQLSKTFGTGDWSKFASLNVYDNPHTRDSKFINLSNTNTSIFNSSLNTIYVEYKLLDASKPAPGLFVNFTVKDCKTLYNDLKPRFCPKTKRCLLPEFVCNNVNDCGDNFDEIHCNTTAPPPPPSEPTAVSGGVNGWVIVLVIIPMSVGVGVLMTLFGPLLLSRVRGGRYSEFRNFAEDT